MAHGGRPMIAFHGVNIYNILAYTCICLCLIHVTYVVKEVLLSQGPSQLMGVARKRTYVQVVPTRRKNVASRICS